MTTKRMKCDLEMSVFTCFCIQKRICETCALSKVVLKEYENLKTDNCECVMTNRCYQFKVIRMQLNS